MKRTAIACVLVLIGCSNGGAGLGDDEVTGIAAGTASGTSASGTYALRTLTTGCEGACTGAVSGFTVSVCDLGARLSHTAALTQSDGHLRIDSEDSDYVSRLAGGLDADGSFDVGGIRTLRGDVRSNIRATGVLDLAGGTIEGTVRGWVYGSASGVSFDCRIETELTGARM